MSIRLTRLKADYDQLKETFWESPYVKFKVLEGDPPTRYLITYKVKGLGLPSGSSTPVVRNTHRVEIYLPGQYPLDNPICTLKTPHFHPNIFTDNSVCLGEWAVGAGLVEIVIGIGKMIQYQKYNLSSPANGDAESWTQDNKDKLPIDDKDIGELKELDFDLKPLDKIEEANEDEDFITFLDK